MKFTYLLIDFLTIVIPFVFSFHPRLNFYKTWGAFFPAVILTGLFFIGWDAYFTSRGVWGFNMQYITGILVTDLPLESNLPLEEVLFFFCIPYACVFTFYCLQPYVGKRVQGPAENAITISLITFLTIAGIIHYDRLYTVVTFFSLSVLLVFARYVLKIKWLAKFYIIYAILLIPFLIVNGILTGTGLEHPLVWYNSEEIMGARILTIPIEDIFYGLELMLMNLLIYLYLSRHGFVNKEVLNRA